MSDSAELPEQHAIRLARAVAGHHWELPDNLQDALHINYNADPERVQAVNEAVAELRIWLDGFEDMAERGRIPSKKPLSDALTRLDEMEKRR